MFASRRGTGTGERNYVLLKVKQQNLIYYDDAGDDRLHLMVCLGMFFPVGPHLSEGLAIKFSLSHLIYSLSPSLLRFSVLTP